MYLLDSAMDLIMDNGIDTAKKDAAIAFAELHVPVEQIASALQVNVEIAKQWIGNK